MTKPTKRKGFSFLRSYFDVLNQLDNDDDKLSFLLSIINKQFLDEDPKDLNFIVKLCYESQRHAIEKSVKGWITAFGTDLLGNALGSDTPPSTHPKGLPSTLPKQEEQEKGEVEEKEKGEEQQQKGKKIINNDSFLVKCFSSSQWLETICMRCRVDEDVIKLYLKHFRDHLIVMEEQKSDTKGFKEHFSNWINKQDLSQHRKKVIGKSNQIQ